MDLSYIWSTSPREKISESHKCVRLFVSAAVCMILTKPEGMKSIAKYVDGWAHSSVELEGLQNSAIGGEH